MLVTLSFHSRASSSATPYRRNDTLVLMTSLPNATLRNDSAHIDPLVLIHVHLPLLPSLVNVGGTTSLPTATPVHPLA